jgi:hypothetical protein
MHQSKMEQMMERLLAGMKAEKMANMDANRREMKAHHEEMMAKMGP